MAVVRAGSRLSAPCLCMVTVGMILLVGSVLWIGAVGTASATESAGTLLQEGERNTLQLPDGMNPMDVVRMVDRNRLGVGGMHGESNRGLDSSRVLQAGAHDKRGYLPPVPVGRPAPVDEMGLAFHIGGDGVYRPSGSNQGNPSIAFDGTNYLVVWAEERNESDIYGARVSVEGEVLDPVGIPISTAAYGQGYPSVVFNGEHYFVVWEDGRSGHEMWSRSEIYGARVSAGGEMLDPEGIAILTDAWYDKVCPSIAFDGTNYLVVWGEVSCGGCQPGADIAGARVSVGGEVLDTSGIAISRAAGFQVLPSVAFDGTNYLVAWENCRTEDFSYDIRGARVSVAGEVLDTSGIAISTSASYQAYPSIAFDGANYLVVWGDYRSGTGYDINGARVTVAGAVLDPVGMPVTVVANNQLSPAVAFDGINYLVVWEDDRNGGFGSSDIYGTRVSVAGEVLDPSGIVISTAVDGQWRPSVAFDGTNYLVVWEDKRNSNQSMLSSYDVYGARVSVEGEVLDTSGIAIAQVGYAQWNPSVAFGGMNCLVVWEDGRNQNTSEIYAARVSVDGVVLDPAGIPISRGAENSRHNPSIAFSGTNYLVVWEDQSGGSSYYDIYGARLSLTGKLLGSGVTAISTAANGQQYPSAAFDGTNYLVVWEDSRSGSGYGYDDIYGARVSVLGAVLDTSGIAISTAAYGQLYPSVAFDGTNYLVAWEDYSGGSGYPDIHGARVKVGGEVLDPDGLVISAAADGQHYPAVARGAGCTTLIAYSCFSPAPYGSVRIWGNFWKGPTAVAFASASAEAEQGYVRLSWQMAVEAVASSFRVERSDSRGGTFVELALPVATGPGFTFSCTDHSVRAGQTYWYRIVLLGASGVDEETCGPIEVRVDEAPTAFMAYQSYPNPFNPRCTIRYDIQAAGAVSLRVFGVNGALVRTLVDSWREPGMYREVWDGRDDAGSEQPSGVYFYRIEAGSFVATRKMVLLK